MDTLVTDMGKNETFHPDKFEKKGYRYGKSLWMSPGKHLYTKR